MNAAEKAVETAYEGQVKELYQVLSIALLEAGENELHITEAESKFITGLTHVGRVRSRALELIAQMTS